MEILRIKLLLISGFVGCVMTSSFSSGDFEFVSLSRLIRSSGSDNSDDDGKDFQLQTFNRPPGTQALIVNVNSPSLSTQYGRTFGQYGSYRNHQTWQNAVNADRRRHTLIHTNLRETFPWLFRNLKTPSLSGFSLNGFWNSYAPAVPMG